MTNAERIRNMTDEELNKFLWWFKISEVSAFLTKGGAGVLNALEQKEWLQSHDNAHLEHLLHYPGDE